MVLTASTLELESSSDPDLPLAGKTNLGIESCDKSILSTHTPVPTPTPAPTTTPTPTQYLPVQLLTQNRHQIRICHWLVKPVLALNRVTSPF